MQKLSTSGSGRKGISRISVSPKSTRKYQRLNWKCSSGRAGNSAAELRLVLIHISGNEAALYFWFFLVDPIFGVVFVIRNYDVEIYLMELINIISIGWHVNRHYLLRDFFFKKMKISGTELWIFFTQAMSSF